MPTKRKTVVSEQLDKETSTRNQRKASHSINLSSIVMSEKQLELVNMIKDNHITFITGPAGTSKTFTTCYAALKLLADKKIEHIVLVKPIQESGEQLGFLPGSVEEKTNPYYESFKTNFYKICGKETYANLIKSEAIEYKQLAYLRGASIDNSLIVLDEAQNCDIRSLMLFITRMGENSKIILLGDISQHDIKEQFVGLPYLMKRMGDIDGVGKFLFSNNDIRRHPILITITERYEKDKSDKSLPLNKNK